MMLQIKFGCDQPAAGAQFEGDLGEILTLGAEISPYIGLREKLESPKKKKKNFFSSFHLVSTP